MCGKGEGEKAVSARGKQVWGASPVLRLGHDVRPWLVLLPGHEGCGTGPGGRPWKGLSSPSPPLPPAFLAEPISWVVKPPWPR